MHVFVVGLSHRTAPLWLRERVAYAPESGAAPCVAARAAVPEAFVLSTCNRVEVYGAAPRAELAAAAERMLAVLAERAEVTVEALRGHAYVHLGDDAVRHLCRVAAGLDSLLVGETQIVGQLKRAVTDARRHGAVGRVLQRLSCTVLAASKRARARLVRAEGPASVAELAVRAAGGAAALTGRLVVVIGAGETAADVLDAIALARPREVVVVNRSAERAARLAARHRARSAPWARLGALVGEADVVFACTATPEPVVVEAHFLDVPPRRRTILDLGVPRNVDPAVASLAGTTLVDVDALALWRYARDDAPGSTADAPTAAAEAAIGHWVARFRKWLRAQEVVVPTIAQLRADAERIRVQELERALARLGDLTEREREIVRALSARLVNKLLHAPLSALGAEPDMPALAESARLLFGLPPHAAPASGAADALVPVAPVPAPPVPAPVTPHGDAAPRAAVRA